MNVIEQFWKDVERLYKPQPPVETEYRVYHKNNSILYSISEPKATCRKDDYIVITREQYLKFDEAWHQNKIVDGKLVQVLPTPPGQLLLEKSDDGPYTTVKDNMIFVDDKGDKYKKIIRYG